MTLKENYILFEIFKQAELKLDKTFNSPDLVPFGEKILNHIENNPLENKKFERQFRDIWESKQGPHELIAFCMHKLKWADLKEYFQSKHKEARKNEDWRAWHCLEDILDAFNDNWEDARDFYSEYFNYNEGGWQISKNTKNNK